MASWLVRSIPDRAVWVQALAWDIALGWAKLFTLTGHLSTRVYKWVLANLILGMTLRWISIPSRGIENNASCFMLQKPGYAPSDGPFGSLLYVRLRTYLRYLNQIGLNCTLYLVQRYLHLIFPRLAFQLLMT